MLQAIVDYLRPPAITETSALQRFLSGEASYLAQRSTYEFSRNTLAWFGQWAFGDDKFNDAFRLCRWEAFAAVLADMVVLTHEKLQRSAAEGSDALVAALTDLYEAALTEYPVPAHRPAGWVDRVQALRVRLGQAALAGPLAPAEVARTAARRIYEVLPVHSSNPDADYEAIEAAIRFGMVSFHDKLWRRLQAEAVSSALLDRARTEREALEPP
jgi:hypothetical protein